ncbi:ABC transporter substrate-binding protein [Allokutzneria sp. A3M-2-11 16]|uniref:ABC transporter substrate-binding protein n=1 Tax=Allokutzneria sp. A3M-2-11 16 TaxID=2962043 RepID=UPI0020B84376|nr:ABC transporter substrate-binding protein [Allokutzneria sp. A3M-2-11 16]MCP3803133.1 ABC transporter substrate-binding protein [Allokutzneria sp. A3M-2-11 16]
MSEIVFGLDALPVNRDPHWPVDVNGRLLAGALLRPLWDDGFGSAVDAESLDDGKLWRVTLSDSLRWSDGQPLAAEDAVRAATRAIERRPGLVSAVRAVDAHTVEYQFARPVGYAPHVLSMTRFAPVRDDLVLGPYAVSSWESSEIVLERNPWHAFGSDQPKRLVFRLTEKPDEILAAYANGEIDVTPITSFGPAELTVIKDRPDLIRRDILLYGSLDFGSRSGSLGTSGHLRAALGRLLRRTEIAAATGGTARPCWSPLQPWFGEVSEQDGFDAAELRAACPDGRLHIDYADYTPNAEVVGEIARQVREAIGVEVTTASHSFEDYIKLAVSRDHCLLYTLTAPEYPHPAAVLGPWASTGAQARHAGFADAGFDALVTEACTLPDSDAAARWIDVARRWCEVMPKITLLQVRAHCLRAPRVGGLDLAMDGTMPMRNLVVHDD